MKFILTAIFLLLLLHTHPTTWWQACMYVLSIFLVFVGLILEKK